MMAQQGWPTRPGLQETFAQSRAEDRGVSPPPGRPMGLPKRTYLIGKAAA